jgi:hypothetical protein
MSRAEGDRSLADMARNGQDAAAEIAAGGS